LEGRHGFRLSNTLIVGLTAPATAPAQKRQRNPYHQKQNRRHATPPQRAASVWRPRVPAQAAELAARLPVKGRAAFVSPDLWRGQGAPPSRRQAPDFRQRCEESLGKRAWGKHFTQVDLPLGVGLAQGVGQDRGDALTCRAASVAAA